MSEQKNSSTEKKQGIKSYLLDPFFFVRYFYILSTPRKDSSDRKGSHLVKSLIDDPSYNFAALLAALASIYLLAVTSLTDNAAGSLQWNLFLERILLIYFAGEMILRAAARPSYFKRIHFWIDLITLSPLLYETVHGFFTFSGFIDEPLSDFWIIQTPGIILLRGFRILRLLYFFRFFYSKSVSGFTKYSYSSPLKLRFFTGISSLQFMVIFMLGFMIAQYHNETVQNEKERRMQQITSHIIAYGPASANASFQNRILRLKKETLEENYEINNLDPEYVKEFYRYGYDFIQLDNVSPGVSVQITFADLNRRQRLLELTILLFSVLSSLGLIMSLNYFLEKSVLEPINRASRILSTRKLGEPIEETFEPGPVENEVTALILDFDDLYKRMLRRAD